MKNALRAAGLAMLLLAMPAAVVGCASSPTATSIAPKSVSQALAEAEISFTGIVVTADSLHSQGVLTTEQASAMFPAVQQISDGLDAAETALALGRAADAQTGLAKLTPILAAITAQLVALKEKSQ